MTTKLVLLMMVFLAVPILLFWQFQVEDRAKNRVLRTSLVGHGQAIATMLRPTLQQIGLPDPERLASELEQVASEGVQIKLLFRAESGPAPGRIYYIASSPPPDRPEDLQADLDEMISKGILQWMATTCEVRDQSTKRFKNRLGKIELITSVTPVPVANGCWAIMTAHANQTLISSSLGRETWRTPAVQIAGIIYGVMAGLVVWLAFDIWTNLQRFRKGAQRLRSHTAERVSFAELNQIPELNGAAEEFDRLVRALANSRHMMRQAAEENAHALKTPLATIAQAIEPLRRSLTPDDKRGLRSLNLIEKSIDRLDSLVSAARDLERVAADSFNPETELLDLSQLVMSWIKRSKDALTARSIQITAEIDHNLRVQASEDGLETIFENLIENAASFAPEGSAIEIDLRARDRSIELVVADTGPGVDPQFIDHIFERYFSHRPGVDGHPPSTLPQAAATHFGLGLWIVRRYTEAFGGTVSAENRPTGGFLITVSLPIARN